MIEQRNIKNKILIGTRGSRLALKQSEMVKIKLLENFPEIKIDVKIIKTKGDRILDSPLSKIGEKGLFIKEIEEALLNGEIDLAVHSMKDLPTEMPEKLIIGAVLEREDPRDAFLSFRGISFQKLSAGSKIATSSLRRRAQLMNLRKDIHIVDIRGNVETRINKMESGYCEAIVLAAAGLKRIDLVHKITAYFEIDQILPAVSQGIIGIQCMVENRQIRECLKVVNHEETFLRMQSERAFLGRFKGGCQVPIGCYSEVIDEKIKIFGMISDIDGNQIISSDTQGEKSSAVEIAERLADEILSLGGKEMLKKIK